MNISRHSNLLPVARQVLNRKLWPSSLRHSCTGFKSYCKYSHLNTDLSCQLLCNIITNHSNSKDFRCPVFTGTVKKGISQVLLPCLNFFYKRAWLKDSISKYLSLKYNSNTPNLVWFGMKCHLYCLMWKLLIWFHLFPITFNYDPFTF